ncbi:hypothetical protein CEXT_272301 [Caerostris extrusa]|uniref:Uncharacterized protein n=1 Tax=Caerostris extrusa TaxID=172846 RepID=A0AAV4T3S4_CAEEX|nr:hypothetical protein CEXT_272301 [Caerostris extrusa]
MNHHYLTLTLTHNIKKEFRTPVEATHQNEELQQIPDKYPITVKPPLLKMLIEQANTFVKDPAIKPILKPVEIKEQEVLTFEDVESSLIADCKKDSECGIHAVCNSSSTVWQVDGSPKNFCRCKDGFIGNGMFAGFFKNYQTYYH